MQDKAPEHYEYPLLIKQLLHHPLAVAPDREIVYADKNRYSYTEFNTRLQRLANALTDAGVKHGQTVAVMDWDSHRYLECFFAVPTQTGSHLLWRIEKLEPYKVQSAIE